MYCATFSETLIPDGSGFVILANPVPPQEVKARSSLTVSKSNSISLISPVTAAFVAKTAVTPTTAVSFEYSITLSNIPYQYVTELSKSSTGSIIILFLSPFIVAEKETSAPLTSPILTATLFETSESVESSKFLKNPFVAISKFVVIELSTDAFTGLYS